MTIVLTVLLAVLKFVGWLLLFLLALLVVLLILPVELRFAYQAGKPSLTAWYGPLHFTLWPRAAAKDTAAQHPAAPQPAPAAQPSAEPALSKTQPAPAAAPAAQSPQASVAAKAAPTPAPATEFTGEHPKSSALPFHISERIETALNLLAHDPAAFVRCMFGHLRWVGRFLARHIKVQHLTVFWTVTGEDAAQTAELYGAAMAAANNLLAFLQQVVCPAMRPFAAGVGFHRPTQGRASHFRQTAHPHVSASLAADPAFVPSGQRPAATACTYQLNQIAFCFYKRRSFPWQSIRSKV